MIIYHVKGKGSSIAEIIPGSGIINTSEDLLDLMGEASFNGSTAMIIHSESLNRNFFDLKTKVAGEILQKFSNYRMKLAVVGSFTEIKSKSLRDFIRESNTRGTIIFVGSVEEAMARFNK
jgi:hypothetical protein